jgi:hypothetical protein
LILITLLLLAIQAISNLIYDWNREPESHDPAIDVELSPEEIAALRLNGENEKG